MVDLYQEWQKYFVEAKNNTLSIKKKYDKILIEIAAQHPLVKGYFPNEEFSKRLLLGYQLYQDLEKENPGNVYFYIPGSLHKYNEKKDKISLAQAGENFLNELGIPRSKIYSDSANAKYTHENGVYNSVDECFVATEIVKNEHFKELHCVCSSGQMMRKVLIYIKLGLVPYMHTVSCDEMYHNYIYEIFNSIPQILKGETKEQEETRSRRKTK